MKIFDNEYMYFLNSPDLYDPALPLSQPAANGGTAIMWRSELDPHITVIPSDSPAYQAVLFRPPGHLKSIHIAVYLPTQGQESYFVDSLAQLSLCIEHLQDQHPEAALYLRGDFNVNENNRNRNTLLKYLCSDHYLKIVPISHKTYHHFTGGGLSDSNLDKILFSSWLETPEYVVQIICKISNPVINSHHDLIVSALCLPSAPIETATKGNIKAPKVENSRTKISWSESGINMYQQLVQPQLLHLQNLWLLSPSRTCLSLLTRSTNELLANAAVSTNKAVHLGLPVTPRVKRIPAEIKKSQRILLALSRKLSKAIANNFPAAKICDLKGEVKRARAVHQCLVRRINAQASILRDEKLYLAVDGNPSSLYKSIRSSRNNKAGQVQRLTVRDRVYLGSEVADGFYDSLQNLKSVDCTSLVSSESYSSFAEDFEGIMEICANGDKMPPITRTKSDEILLKIKPGVSDLYSITASHYINAGEVGLQHFFLLLSSLITNVQNITITEVNSVFATVLFKGHEKDKTSDRSYRTISICPLVAKALDLYTRELNMAKWNRDQADVQFMGEGSSHDLSALLLTETVQSSLYTVKKPLFALFLDVKSAFDSVLRKILIPKLYHCGTDGHDLLLINNRLESRRTYLEWDQQLMGPIDDELGVEQGGASSGEYYKIFGKEQLSTAQASLLGAPLGSQTISAIGQADDTVLISNCLHSLQNLLKLSLDFCTKHHIQLCIEKTKLVAFSNPSMATSVEYFKLTSPVNINRTTIPFAETVEHVGILRNETSNLVHVMSRLRAHQRALHSVLHVGAAHHHRGNPAGSLRIERLYAQPVLLKGLGSLVLLKAEVDMIDHHIKVTQEKLLRLHPKTPRCVVSFLAGCLPGTALYHLKLLSIFGMVCRLKESILYQHACQVLIKSKSSSRSWFIGIRNICLQYGLPHPLDLLRSPMSKISFKSMVKKRVISLWEEKLRAEAAALSSLKYFKPQYMSLTAIHPIWATAGSNPYQVAMSTVQAIMLSGRYRTEELCSKWSPTNPGTCKAPSCSTLQIPEDLNHILVGCASLEPSRVRLRKFASRVLELQPQVTQDLYNKFSVSVSPVLVQFLVDCTVLPEVIRATQVHGISILEPLFRITRTWCYSLHRERLKILGRWTKF